MKIGLKIATNQIKTICEDCSEEIYIEDCNIELNDRHVCNSCALDEIESLYINLDELTHRLRENYEQ